MAQRSGRSGNPAKRTPEGVKVQGSTTIALGCETCPGRREVAIAVIGGISLSSDPDMVPFAVSTSTRVTAKNMETVTIRKDIVSLDQERCDKPAEAACPYAETIAVLADGIEGHPAKLEWQLNQPVTEVQPPGTEGI